jgi:hypothetical protein
MSMLDSRLHAAAHLRAQSPPPLLADRISTRDLFLKKMVTLSDVDKLDQRCLRGGRRGTVPNAEVAAGQDVAAARLRSRWPGLVDG